MSKDNIIPNDSYVQKLEEAVQIRLFKPSSPQDILQRAINLIDKKGKDYNSGGVSQADYYIRGVASIHEMLHHKWLRAKSLIGQLENNPDAKPNFESLGDTFIDMVNYAAFAASWLEGGIDGQTNKDPLNRKPKV